MKAVNRRVDLLADSYIPAQDPQALIWMQTFAQGITANPALYGLVAADALAITTAVNAFDAALDVSSDPTTRTPVNIAAKDDARVAAEQKCRQFANRLELFVGLDDDGVGVSQPVAAKADLQ